MKTIIVWYFLMGIMGPPSWVNTVTAQGPYPTKLSCQAAQKAMVGGALGGPQAPMLLGVKDMPDCFPVKRKR